ncbi:MAG: T9SS type A sorting domain-containing protein [candidate division Zixibacteria bacterium]|nr:T9SS type A sorting domain-containing protein [candidate division Zixibacteria bacterium]
MKNRISKIRLLSVVVFAFIAVIAVRANAEEFMVDIVDFSFNPRTVTVAEGDNVIWTNQDQVGHTSTEDDGMWDSGLLSHGQTYSRQFMTAGTYNYHCTLHPNMTATIVVEPTTGVDDFNEALPTRIELHQNYPNPFNAKTNIEFDLNVGGEVTLEIYNLIGERIDTPVNQLMSAGHHSIMWDSNSINGGNISSGVYFYQLKVGDNSQTMKMILLK